MIGNARRHSDGALPGQIPKLLAVVVLADVEIIVIYVTDFIGLRRGELHPVTAQCHLHRPPGTETYLVGPVGAGQLLERG